ncbi:MAG TPA: tail fiber domain-containing protein [Rhodothermales bacterium]|nr:tail fiber domain-containing protein [Rhodothermales bacterium]
MRTVMMLILLGGVPSLATAQLDTLMQARVPGGASRLLLLEDGGFALRGAFGVGAIPATGPGVRLMWYPKRAAFRAGFVDGAQWDDANIGSYSTAMGFGTTASGSYSTAMGIETTASNYNTTAMGEATEASGSSSTAMGYSTMASGYNTTAMGNGTTAQAMGSLVIGRHNLVSGTPDAWVETEPLFVAGNGQNSGNRSNALTLLKNGRLGLGTASPADALEVRTNTPTTALRLKTTHSWPLRMEQTDSSFFAIYNGGQPRMTIVYNGRVGIGTTTPSSRLDVNGTVRATDFVNTSDARLKRDIRPLDDPLDLVAGLRGVSYAWDRAQHPEWEPGQQLGFLAQEVAEVLPEIVHEDEAGYLSVNYQAMLPVLVEALKTQQGEITALREALETQGREIKALLHKFDALRAEATPSTRKAASH